MYFPNYTGKDESTRQEFNRLAESLNDMPVIVVPVLNVEPEKPRIGWLTIADGIDWNPIGAGAPRLVWFNGISWVALDA